jgi:serine/threonine-protein kinase RsbW
MVIRPNRATAKRGSGPIVPMYFDVAICLPQEAETVALIRAAITDTLRLFGVADECAEDIRLSLSEACTNVIAHASSEDEYEVRVRIDDEHCEITVRNTGVGFDAAALTGVMPDPSSARGRGVAIMHAVMDNVDLTSGPSAGTIVHLVRDLIWRDNGPVNRLRERSRNARSN